MDNNNTQRRRPLHDPIRVRARDSKLWTAEEAAATLANVMKVRCKCRSCRGQTWVSRRTSAKHLKELGRHPRLRANVDVRIHLTHESSGSVTLCILNSNIIDFLSVLSGSTGFCKLVLKLVCGLGLQSAI